MTDHPRDELLEAIGVLLDVAPSAGFAARVRAVSQVRSASALPWRRLALCSAAAASVSLVIGVCLAPDSAVREAVHRRAGHDIRLATQRPAADPAVDLMRAGAGRVDRALDPRLETGAPDDLPEVVIDPRQRALVRAMIERTGPGLMGVPGPSEIEAVAQPVIVHALRDVEPIVIPPLPLLTPLPGDPGS